MSLGRELQVSVCGTKWCHLQVVSHCRQSMLARWLQELQPLEDSSRKAGPVMWHPGEGLHCSSVSGGRVLGEFGLWLVKRPSDRFKSPTEAACSQSAINTAGNSVGILDGALLRNMFFYTEVEILCIYTKKNPQFILFNCFIFKNKYKKKVVFSK